MNAFYRFLFPSKSNESMTSAILLIVRLIFGILLMSHGIQKWSHFNENGSHVS